MSCSQSCGLKKAHLVNVKFVFNCLRECFVNALLDYKKATFDKYCNQYLLILK